MRVIKDIIDMEALNDNFKEFPKQLKKYTKMVTKKTAQLYICKVEDWKEHSSFFFSFGLNDGSYAHPEINVSFEYMVEIEKELSDDTNEVDLIIVSENEFQIFVNGSSNSDLDKKYVNKLFKAIVKFVRKEFPLVKGHN